MRSSCSTCEDALCVEKSAVSAPNGNGRRRRTATQPADTAGGGKPQNKSRSTRNEFIRNPRKLTRDLRKLTRAPRKLVHDLRKLVRNSRKLVRNPRKLVHDPRKLVHDLRKLTRGSRKLVRDPQKFVRDPRKFAPVLYRAGVSRYRTAYGGTCCAAAFFESIN
ncbi:MAG: hypothetical protein LBR86_00075 [Tannerella sp.]|nr:hypothetical protein [Tannerella sp.]